MMAMARLTAVSFAIVALLIVSAPEPVRAIEVGQVAPNFSLPSTTGGTVSLGQFRSKSAVLIEFYGVEFDPT